MPMGAFSRLFSGTGLSGEGDGGGGWMPKVVFVALGTRGDVQPCLAVAAAVAAGEGDRGKGCLVVFASHGCVLDELCVELSACHPVISRVNGFYAGVCALCACLVCA